MEIVMPGKDEKKSIHPVAIIKQAWSVGWKNIGKLSVIYLIFSLPVTVISLSPIIRFLPDQKLSLTAVLWFLFLIIISSWRHIALLLGANQAVSAQDYSVGQSINQAQAFLIKYLALMLSIILFILGVIIVAGVSAAVVGAFLAQVNKMSAVLIGFILIIAVIASLVFFLLRWSLAALVCVFENARPRVALNGSFSLVKEHINPVVGTYGLMGLICIACMTPVVLVGTLSGTGPNVNAPTQVGTTIYITLISIVLEPFWTIITVILYKKLKEVSGAHVYA